MSSRYHKEVPLKRKPGKPATSCAECRRLKTRCDRQVPCSSCKLKGCAKICPNGSLTPRKHKGTLVLSTTPELHNRIDHLLERATALENALVNLDPAHPLLEPNLLALKLSTEELEKDLPVSHKYNLSGLTPAPHHGVHTMQPTTSRSHSPSSEDTELWDPLGTLAIEETGSGSAFLGGSSRVEYLLRAGDLFPDSALRTMHSRRLNPRIVSAVSSIFKEPEYSILVSDILDMVPTPDTATRLFELYLANFEFLYPPIPRSELFDRIFRSVYHTSAPSEDLKAYALLFNILALGAIFDSSTPAGELTAHDYHILAQACISHSPACGLKPSLDSVEIIQLSAMYMHIADQGSMPRHDAWLAASRAMRLAISIGLHLDSKCWNLSDDDAARRSRVFWTGFLLLTHIGFGLGRPPLLSPEFIGCPLPRDTLGLSANSTSYHIWTMKYGVLLHTIQKEEFSCKIPTYNSVINLDNQVRTFPVPENLQMKTFAEIKGESASQTMPRMLVLVFREGTLLVIHKRYLAAALRDNPHDLFHHKYAASVFAAYRSSWRLIEALVLFWSSHLARPSLGKLAVQWSYALAAGVTMCDMAIRAPACTLVNSTLVALDKLVEVFESATSTCQFASHHMDLVRGLRDNAHEAVKLFQNGEVDDRGQILAADFDRLSGKTHLVFTSALKVSHVESASVQQTGGSYPLLDMNVLDEMFAETLPAEESIQWSNMHQVLVQDLSYVSNSGAPNTAISDFSLDYTNGSTFT